MKYDLIVVGGGPGGLMAAKTAVEDGLKVVLVERKKNVSEINRACSQMFGIRMLAPSGESESGEENANGYIEPVSIEVGADKSRFHFLKLGLSLDYIGPLRPYLNWIQLSPSGHRIHRYKLNDRPWAFNYSKSIFLAGLLTSAQEAGAEVWPETIGLGAENIRGGVKVRVQGKSAEQTLEARAAIAADGRESRIVESLGLNQKRQVLGLRQVTVLQYIMEGVETGLPDSAWLTWTSPSINPYGSVFISLWTENRHALGTMTAERTSPKVVLDKFINHPQYTHMFRHARVVKRESMGRIGTMLGPIRKPLAGNVVIIGDSGAPVETTIPGASACGYQAVKAIEKELDGQDGYSEYIAWWQQAFAFNTLAYIKMARSLYPLPRICTDEDIDYIYSLFRDRIGIPEKMVANHMELIKKGRPELYQKLIKSRM
jgi:digeranylgeranylglycerophospholipid reductase